MTVWRVVKSGMATLEELETWWSLDDLMRANAVLDIEADMTEAANAGA